MDIDLLSKIIKELIGGHDSVGLPGLGTFVAEEMPATFSDRGYTINPPYRRLSFHPSRTEDTLLVDFYAESNNFSREMANAYITEFLSELRQVLIQRKTVVFPGLGRLRATRENNFFFVPNEDLDIYEEGFALKPVSLKNLQAVEEKLVIPVSFEQALRGLRRAEAGREQAVPADGDVSRTELTAVAEVQTEQEAGVGERAVREQETETVEVQPVTDASAAPATEPQAAVPTAAPNEAATAAESAGAAGVMAEEMAEPAESGSAETMAIGATESSGETPASPCRTRLRKWGVAVLVAVSVIAVALGTFIVLAHAAPDFMDSLLYTKEELEILNY